MSRMDPILPPERARAMRAAGLWPDRLITDYLDEAAATKPNQLAVADHNSMTGRASRLTYRELAERVDRMAVGLAKLGVEAGDVVAFQLPNWWQFVALYLACVRIGAVGNPLMPIFRARELKFMLGFAEAKVMVVPRTFRNHDYAAMMEDLRKELPALQHVLVVDDSPQGSFERTLLDGAADTGTAASKLFAARRPGPDDVTELQYTSGTTGEPKGVMHTANTLLSNVLAYQKVLSLSGRDIVLMGSPLAHQTGFLYGVLSPIILGTTTVLLDIWNPADAARLIEQFGVTFTMGATPFVADMADTPALQQHKVSSLRVFVTAGAPVPRVLVQRAQERLGCKVLSAWGMTENGAVTMTSPSDPPEKVFNTDGKAFPGFEVRVVDADTKPVPHGVEGRLQARGMCNFVGYLKRPERYDTDADGWFETGDLARMDADGYIRISGRAKDIIIRGGENIPVAEVEGALYRHPLVQDAAVVAMPDERLGERACAFVVTREGKPFTFDTMIAHLQAEKMSRSYFPERLEVVTEMPRTASGKIQKFRLRQVAGELKPTRSG